MKLLIWLVFAVAMLGGLMYFLGKPTVPPSASAGETVIPDLPSRHVSIAKASWRKGGLDNVAFGTFSIKNDADLPVKDVALQCDFFGSSGTKIGAGSATIFQTVPAKATKAMPEVSLGLIDSQVATMSCVIAGTG